MILTITILCSVIFYIVTAIMEGFFFHTCTKANLRFKYPHQFLVTMRMCYWLLLYLVTINIEHTLGLIFIFSFIHDGIYYVVRHKLNNKIYLKGFFDESTTSTAILEFNFILRSILFIVGIALLLYSFINLLN